MNKNICVEIEDLLQVGMTSKGLSFLPNKKINSILSGRHASKLRGRGMDFLELKSYIQGDDTKNIDWKATRRSNKTYVRVFNEERDRAVYVVTSQQSNMFFGSRGSFKSVQAAKLASIAIHTVLSSGDRVGGVVFNDEELINFKASKSKKSSIHYLKELSRLNKELIKREQKPNRYMFNKALDFLMTQVKHDDLIFIIGDGSGLDDESKEKVTYLNAHNDIITAMVYDPMERELPDSGSLLFRDYKNFFTINSSDEKFKQLYMQQYQEKLKLYRNLSLMHKIPLLEIATNEDVFLQLQVQLGHLK